MNKLTPCILSWARPGETVGGVESFIIGFGEWVRKQGYDVFLLVSDTRKIARIRKLEDVIAANTMSSERRIRIRWRVRYPKKLGVLALLAFSFVAVIRIASLHKKTRIHVLHAQDPYSSLASLVLSRFLGIPVVLTPHGVFPFIDYYSQKSSPSRIFFWSTYLLEVFIARRVHKITAISNVVADYYRYIGAKEERIAVTNLAIDLFKFQPEKQGKAKVFSKGENEILVGYVGRLSAEKGINVLLEAYAKLSAELPIRLALIGPGRIEDFEHDIPRDKLILTGSLFNINEILPEIDIYVLPSFTEGFPISMIEAMAAGRAIIVSDIPSVREIVNDEEAILVEPNNPTMLRQAILLLSGDEKLRVRIGGRAREKAKLYDVNKIYPRFLEAYRQVVSYTIKSRKKSLSATRKLHSIQSVQE